MQRTDLLSELELRDSLLSSSAPLPEDRRL